MDDIDRLPDLTPEQKRIVREVHAYWRKNRRPPRTVTLSVPLRKEFDFKTALEGIHWRIISRHEAHSDNEVLKLRIAGLSLCSGEERAVEAFLSLLRRAANQAISDLDSKPKITRTDLRNALGNPPQEEFELITPIIRDAIGGSNSTSAEGEWSHDTTLAIIRFEHVSTINEYLRKETLKPRNIAVLERAHIDLLSTACMPWRTNGVWPGSRRLITDYRSKGDAISLLKEIPRRYLREGHYSNLESKPVELTLDGIAVADPDHPDLTTFVHLIKALVNQFESSPENAVSTIADLSEKSNVPQGTVKRLAEIMSHEWRLGVEYRHEAVPFLKLRELVLDFDGVDSFIDYVSKRENLEKRSGLPEYEGMEDAMIQRAILELFAAQPADGSKHLNRTNVLGRPYHAGDLERQLNHTFTIEERGRAHGLVRKLEADGLLIPTYRDIISPADWLIITAKGREALLEPPDAPSKVDEEFDAFLCHASEDKAAIVTAFAAAMKEAGLRPWLDAAQVGWGESLIKAVEHGLTKSTFVIVFISEISLKKAWPEKELRAALSMEIDGVKKVLPVTLGIEHDALQKLHPFVAEKLYKAIRPYDPAKPVATGQLAELVTALKAELAKTKK